MWDINWYPVAFNATQNSINVKLVHKSLNLAHAQLQCGVLDAANLCVCEMEKEKSEKNSTSSKKERVVITLEQKFNNMNTVIAMLK